MDKFASEMGRYSQKPSHDFGDKPHEYTAKYADIESQETLYPGLGAGENNLRLGFIRKVYGILTAQLAVTTAMVAVFQLVDGVQEAVVGAPGLMMFAAFAPLIGMIPLYCYRHSHPINLIMLGLWTMCLGLTTSIISCNYSGDIVLEALFLTAAITCSLTAYTFLGVKKGEDFGYLGPMLFAGLMTMILGGLLQLFFPMGEFTHFLFAMAGAGIFSLYIVYDTNELIKRYSVDEYVWATVGLYLDIINLFIRLLEILNYLQNGGRGEN